MPVKLVQDGESYFVGEGDSRVEVDLSGWVQADGVVPKEHFESEITRRVNAAKRGLVKPDDLLGDESFLDRVVDKHRDTLVERLGVKPKEADLDRVRKSIEKEFEPVRTELDGMKAENGKLRERAYRADFEQAANSVGVDEELRDLVAKYIRDRVEYLPEAGEFVVVDKDGAPVMSGTFGKGRAHPYQTVGDLLKEIESGGERKSWFKTSARTGAGVQGGQHRAGAITVDSFRKMSDGDKKALYDRDPETWRAMMKAIRDEGTSRLFGGGM